MTTTTTLRTGDRVVGTNPFTGERVRGTIEAINQSALDSHFYAQVGDAVIDAAHLSRDIRTCRRARPNLDDHGYAPRGADEVTCLNCGQSLYGFPDDSKDWGTAWTHNPNYVPARFR